MKARPQDDPTLFQRLASRVLERMPPAPQGQVLLISSARRGEGKSFIAEQLAGALRLQTSGSVLLVGCTPDRRQAAHYEATGIAWSELVASSGAAEARLSGLLAAPGANYAEPPHPDDGQLIRLPFGNGDAATSFRAANITRVIDAFRKSFDFIILDGPVLTQCGVLINCADAGLLVINASKTRREIIKGCLQSDPLMSSKLLGAVLNRRPQPVPEWLYRRAL